MRRAAFISVALVGVLSSGCENPDTTDYDPVGVAAAAANMELVSVPPEHVASCVEATKFGAFVGDDAAQSRWEAARESEDALADACRAMGATDPDALATIHWNWTAAQSSIDAASAPPAREPVADCDPSYPDLCLPIGGPDVDCGEISERRFPVLPPDPHGLDDNSDGVGCE